MTGEAGAALSFSEGVGGVGAVAIQGAVQAVM